MDNDLATYCPAMLQGNNRLDRILKWKMYLNFFYNDDNIHNVVFAEGVVHDPVQMLKSFQGKCVIFNICQNTKKFPSHPHDGSPPSEVKPEGSISLHSEVKPEGSISLHSEVKPEGSISLHSEVKPEGSISLHSEVKPEGSISLHSEVKPEGTIFYNKFVNGYNNKNEIVGRIFQKTIDETEEEITNSVKYDNKMKNLRPNEKINFKNVMKKMNFDENNNNEKNRKKQQNKNEIENPIELNENYSQKKEKYNSRETYLKYMTQDS